jgi:AcrR family transcriptional regulator
MVMTAAGTSRDRRRQAIVEVARRLFLNEGYGATSMSAIAGAVGGSKATLYAYFKSKEELFCAVVNSLTEEMGAERIRTEEIIQDFRGVLQRVGRKMLSFICQPDAIAIQRLVIGEAERFPELGAMFFDAGPKAKIQWLGEIMQSGMSQALIRTGDTQLAAEQFFSLCRARSHHYLLWNVMAPPSAADILRDADLAVQLFMDAYDPRLPPLKIDAG